MLDKPLSLLFSAP